MSAKQLHVQRTLVIDFDFYDIIIRASCTVGALYSSGIPTFPDLATHINHMHMPQFYGPPTDLNIMFPFMLIRINMARKQCHIYALCTADEQLYKVMVLSFMKRRFEDQNLRDELLLVLYQGHQ